MINEQTRETDFHIRQFEKTAIMTIAVGIIAAAVYFFLISEYDLDQQYIRAGNCYVALYTVACINDHNDIERCPTADRLCEHAERSSEQRRFTPASCCRCILQYLNSISGFYLADKQQ